jgi:hypothetical protein
MANDEIGQMPQPHTEEPELIPGGVDAIAEDPQDGGLSRDLSPDDNPAVDDVLPEEVAEPDDKSQAPDNGEDAEAGTPRASDGSSGDSSGDSSGADSSGEPRAGQEAEDGSVEPPA